MPTYEYQCKNCDHHFEIWQKMTDEPLTVCPECNGSIRRVLFPAGIVFKGSGFYKTDHGSGAVVSDSHANGHKENGAKTESTGEKKSGSESEKEKTSTVSESKAAAAAD
jgi:putative FmdB family regulatory protein